MLPHSFAAHHLATEKPALFLRHGLRVDVIYAAYNNNASFSLGTSGDQTIIPIMAPFREIAYTHGKGGFLQGSGLLWKV